MKRIVAALLAVFTALAGTASAQEFFIPIGENFKYYHFKSIYITILDETYKYLPVFWAQNTELLIERPYDPGQGTIQEAAEKLLRQLAGQFSLPALYNASDPFRIIVEVFGDRPVFPPVAYNGSGFGEGFTLVQDATGRWRIPEKALTLRLTYSSPDYYLPWVKDDRITLYFTDGAVRALSSGGSGTDGFYGLSSRFAIPEAREEFTAKYPNSPYAGWTRGELTLYGENNTFVTVDLKNGVKIAESNPPPYPVGPRITKIVRKDDTTSISLEGEAGTELIVEFAENLTAPSWESVMYPYVLLTKSARTITHRTSSATGFYRVRPNSAPQKQ